MAASIGRLSSVLCLLGSALWANVIVAYPDGAPESACAWMSPWHEPYTEPSPDPAPYFFRLYADEVASGDVVGVCLWGTTYNEGFMIQAQDLNGTVLGHWPPEGLPATAKALTCNAENDTVTHVSDAKKDVVQLKWQSPSDFSGQVVFKGAVVKGYTTFWTDVTSKPFTLVMP